MNRVCSSRLTLLCLHAGLLALLPVGVSAQDTTMNLSVLEPVATVGPKEAGRVLATVTVPVGSGNIDVVAEVGLESHVETCVNDPSACDGTENFAQLDSSGATIYGCGDQVDNDLDGLTDTEDPDCIGVQGWSLSVEASPCFALSGATVNGTHGGLSVVPPGLRDLEGSFAKTEVVDPLRNGGLLGAVSAVVLSFSNPIIIEQISEISVLRLTGSLDATGLSAGESSTPCELHVIPTDQLGLVGSGEPVKTAVTIDGQTKAPGTCDLGIVLTVEVPEPTPDPTPEPTPDPTPEPTPDPTPDPTPEPTPEPTAPDDLEQAGFRIVVLDPPATVGDKVPPNSGSGVAPWSIEIPVPGDSDVPVRAGVALISRVEACVENPADCSGTENFRIVNEETFEATFGCADGMDNDGNGLVDSDDPDCTGTQGWSLSVVTDPCFNLNNATTLGTSGDLSVRPPGKRDLAGSFARTEIVEPASNGGLIGAVTAVVLSFNNPVILAQTGEEVVLALEGTLDGSAVTGPGAVSADCGIRVIPADETGLVGSGEPVKSAVTIGGRTIRPNVCDAEIRLVPREGPQPSSPFIRGNSNDDGRFDIADAVYTVSALFRNGPAFACEEAADANDDESIDASDAVFTVSYIFGIPSGPAPAAPFPSCGTDPTDETDALTCQGSTRC